MVLARLARKDRSGHRNRAEPRAGCVRAARAGRSDREPGTARAGGRSRSRRRCWRPSIVRRSAPRASPRTGWPDRLLQDRARDAGPAALRRRLPAPARLELDRQRARGLAFTAKDSLLVVDDFAPGGAMSDVARAHREAGRVIRAQGNQAGRARLRPDGTLRPTKPPRCTLLGTGEDSPAASRSGRACASSTWHRATWIWPSSRPPSSSRRRRGLSGAMAAFIAAFATDLEISTRGFTSAPERLRQDVPASHARTGWQVGELGAALDLYLRLADARTAGHHAGRRCCSPPGDRKSTSVPRTRPGASWRCWAPC